MADAPVIATPASAPSPAAVSPAPVAPVVVPAVEAAPVAAPITAPVVAQSAPAPAAEAAAVIESPAATEIPAPADSVLSAAAEPMVKPAEGEAAIAPVPEAPVVAPEPLKYEAFKFPEGMKLPEAEVKGYTDIFAKNQIPQPIVQELIDYHTAQMVAADQRRQIYQHEVWNNTRKGWVDQFKASDIGGNRAETTIAQASGVMARYAGSPENLKELQQVFNMTGAGDHPAVIRLLANVGKVLGEGRPVPASRAAAVPRKSTPKTRYTNSNGA